MILRRLAPLLVLAAGCETSVYYPQPVPPADGWEPACAAPVAATVTVENQRTSPIEVQELLPEDGCPPVLRGTVDPGATADLGDAEGGVWVAYDAETRGWIATFRLVDGENVLAVP